MVHSGTTVAMVGGEANSEQQMFPRPESVPVAPTLRPVRAF